MSNHRRSSARTTMNNSSPPTAIDLFCGAGGLSEGFRQAGYRVLAGNDIDRYAAETFRATHREAEFIEGPIESITATKLLRTAGLAKGELDCLLGGPPCQGYSVYNHQRGMQDSRSRLFEEYLRIVAGVMPRWVVMENVTGITSIANGMVVRAILVSLRALGYNVETQIFRAEEYGVPQERRRILFVGNRLGLPIRWPQPTHGPSRIPFVSVWDAISDLPKLKNGQNLTDGSQYRTDAKSAYQRELRQNSVGVINHSAPKLAPINLLRMEHIPEGGSWRDIPIRLLPQGMKNARRCDHTKRYGRLEKNGLSSTILTKCDLHWGAYIHPEQDRALTVREAARLQSFPDWFEFKGPRTEQYIQVGNAVPPLLGRKIAAAILAGTVGLEETAPKRGMYNSQSELQVA